ncbi:FKBP-type peptidyl-prolyl cis-trans isomerase [Muriicola sp.]|uniref:FKBP-type peptidyl-prolyl cis-trans isomerase n=1 Tax=Muriicola sp. TaxID=2020856 RepID=UPI003C796B36
MQLRKVVLAMTVIVFVLSCGNDDGPGFELIPPQLLSDVVVEDEAALQAYLQTHFYNYEEFENPPADFDFQVVLDTIAGVNIDKRPLLQDVQSLTIEVSSEDFSLDDNETVPHTLYYLIAREGAGGMPTSADSTYIRYEGSLLNGTLFDATSDYTWQYLPFFLRGYSQAVSKFKVGDAIVENPDGTTEITNAGVGVVFIPSGLAYFNGSSNGIPSYSPLIFKITTGLYIPDTDYDGDGIPSILEDLNGDGDVTNDNTDAEREAAIRSPAFPNHLDPDDDEDGILTRDEIIIDAQGNITFPDDDNDGIPNYLDRDS